MLHIKYRQIKTLIEDIQLSDYDLDNFVKQYNLIFYYVILSQEWNIKLNINLSMSFQVEKYATVIHPPENVADNDLVK